MDITINGKKYIINDDIKLGILMRVETDPNNADTIFAFLKEVLIPSPTDKEIDNFRQSDMFNIFQLYREVQEELSIETKKKLSQ